MLGNFGGFYYAVLPIFIYVKNVYCGGNNFATWLMLACMLLPFLHFTLLPMSLHPNKAKVAINSDGKKSHLLSPMAPQKKDGDASGDDKNSDSIYLYGHRPDTGSFISAFFRF